MSRPSRRMATLAGALLAAVLAAGSVAWGDQVESRSGAVLTGTVKSADADSVVIESQAGGRSVERAIRTSLVHAVTVGAERVELHPTPKHPAPVDTAAGLARLQRLLSGAAGGGAAPAGTPPATDTDQPSRTPAEVRQRIDEVGSTPPDWFDQAPLDHPPTLDLSWPHPPAGWNNRKNPGQYIWDIVNPNPDRWRGGIRLLHHILAQQPGDAAVQQRCMDALARMYYQLFQDYERTAFWLEKAGQRNATLAECYWRLGSEEMALQLLREIRFSTVEDVTTASKMLAEMGRTDDAIDVALRLERSRPDEAYMYAGDACRLAGRYDDALGWYQKVLTAKSRNAEYQARARDRAQSKIDAIRLFDALDLTRVPDGAYTDSGPGFNGLVHVRVRVKESRIEAVEVVGHEEKQFYSALTDTPARIIAKQDVKGIDATSAATITSEAIITGAAKALGKAAEQGNP